MRVFLEVLVMPHSSKMLGSNSFLLHPFPCSSRLCCLAAWTIYVDKFNKLSAKRWRSTIYSENSLVKQNYFDIDFLLGALLSHVASVWPTHLEFCCRFIHLFGVISNIVYAISNEWKRLWWRYWLMVMTDDDGGEHVNFFSEISSFRLLGKYSNLFGIARE